MNLKKLLSSLVLSTVMCGGMVAEAGYIPGDKTPLSAIAHKRAEGWLTPGGQRSGWIDPGDDIKILEVQGDWIRVDYPYGKTGRRLQRWFYHSDVLENSSFANENRTSPNNTVKVYKNPNMNVQYGSVWGYEPLVVVGSSGDNRQVIYKAGNGYKMGWVRSGDCIGGQSNNSSNTNRVVPSGTPSNPVVQPVGRPNNVVYTEAAGPYAPWQGRAKYRVTAYADAALTNKDGVHWVGARDEVKVVDESSNSYRVEYPLLKGGVDVRWVSKNAIERVTNTNNNISVSSTASTSSNSLQDKLNSLRGEFKHESIWQQGYMGRYGYPQNSGFDNAWECHGFALLIGNRLSGYSARDWQESTKKDKNYWAKNLKTGDILLYYSGSGTHSIVVISNSNGWITFVDCNGVTQSYANRANYCKIQWDRQKSIYDLGGIYKVLVYPN